MVRWRWVKRSLVDGQVAHMSVEQPSAANPEILLVYNQDITVEAWINPNDQDSNSFTLKPVQTMTMDYYYIDPAVWAQIFLSDGSMPNRIGNAVIPSGQWSHVAYSLKRGESLTLRQRTSGSDLWFNGTDYNYDNVNILTIGGEYVSA